MLVKIRGCVQYYSVWSRMCLRVYGGMGYNCHTGKSTSWHRQSDAISRDKWLWL